MLMQVDLEFDVWKVLTAKRRDESDTITAVIRRQLGLPERTVRKPLECWGSRGGLIPIGSELRAKYDAQMYTARVTHSGIELGKKRFSNPSSAASEITGYPTNGWRWWECRTPGADTWRLLDSVRKGR